jgi:hypothetical protein
MTSVYRCEGTGGSGVVTGGSDGALIGPPRRERGANMALDGHIQELSEKHKKLQDLIETEMSHPDWDEIRILALKKEKLRIKDELERLRCGVH